MFMSSYCYFGSNRNIYIAIRKGNKSTNRYHGNPNYWDRSASVNSVDLVRLLQMEQSDQGLLCLHPVYIFECITALSNQIVPLLALKAPITTAADGIHKYFFIVFQRK